MTNRINVMVDSRLIAINHTSVSILNVPWFLCPIFFFYQHGKVDRLAFCKCFLFKILAYTVFNTVFHFTLTFSLWAVFQGEKKISIYFLITLISRFKKNYGVWVCVNAINNAFNIYFCHSVLPLTNVNMGKYQAMNHWYYVSIQTTWF